MKKIFGKYPTHRLGRCRYHKQRFEPNDEMQAIGELSGFSESTGRLSGAYQRPGLSGEDDVPRHNFYSHSTLMVFFPWFLDTLSGLGTLELGFGIFDIRSSFMNCCNSVVSIISITPVISGLLSFMLPCPSLLFLLVALIPY